MSGLISVMGNYLNELHGFDDRDELEDDESYFSDDDSVVVKQPRQLSRYLNDDGNFFDDDNDDDDDEEEDDEEEEQKRLEQFDLFMSLIAEYKMTVNYVKKLNTNTATPMLTANKDNFTNKFKQFSPFFESTIRLIEEFESNDNVESNLSVIISQIMSDVEKIILLLKQHPVSQQNRIQSLTEVLDKFTKFA